ncbi:hypothetical protein [Roseofilum casamattae]|uniref:Uncharacterized protein n=1 Tax=Roseofilum casamattae BLCC-M143 TaxID=3022442 RepID=A0ABT7BRB9_9CYAN|nr:hypothetical protein [Roseofilum casamattae]MDJ1181735.1 hypothetical protein [Roseofilum casamattae BLCC-M143]
MMNEPNEPPFSPEITDRDAEVRSQRLDEQHIDLKLEVEELYRQVDRLRNWLQTLVSGLLVAILMSIGIASWLWYRLLLSATLERQETQRILAIQEEMQETLQVLDEQLASQERKLSELREQFSTDLNVAIAENRQKLDDLQEQVITIENTKGVTPSRDESTSKN